MLKHLTTWSYSPLVPEISLNSVSMVIFYKISLFMHAGVFMIGDMRAHKHNTPRKKAIIA